MEKLPKKCNNSINLLKDNRLFVAGDKSKLLIVGKEQVKRSRVKNKPAIVVEEDIIEENETDKFLGFIINDMLTWKEPLKMKG